MTESSLLTTHPLPNHYPVTAIPSLASPLPNGSLSDNNIQEEEEYTIKCICVYADDDGNTVYCPKCDTWQHIECYYHGKKVPDEHFCADCFPRDLDAKKATERQKRHREALEGGDRKVKRATSKTQKKKHKDANAPAEQVNGWHHERHESVTSTRDGPPAKKPKTSHRPSGSIISTNGESRKRAGSTVQSYPSPSKSPQDQFRFPAIPTYTLDFLELYERDEGNTNARDNELTIQATNKLFAWRTDPSLVVGPGQQLTAKSPFVRPAQLLDQSKWPQVYVESIRKTDIEYDGRCPTWRSLRIQSPVRKNEIVGEVRGQVGMLEEYCQQKSSSNRWLELRHPDPFVFFHPHMDIYIDSRRSGTRFRYLRRSCRPNVTLKTFVSDNDETRHCFVASQDIPAGSELTTMWFLDQVMFAAEDSEQAQNRRLDWASRVLANFGDCACDAGAACLLAPFDRRYSAKSLEGAPKEKVVRKKKSKKNQTISPFSTGHATNSRAGSEPKILDDEAQSDHRSTPDSSRSGDPSLDITPANVAALDADPLLGTGVTARELRKIQMVEKAFAQKEQEKKDQNGQGQPRKKKRTSGGSTLSTPNVNASKQFAYQSTSHPNTPGAQPSKFNDTPLGSPPPPRGSPGRGKSMDAPGKRQSRAQQPAYTSVAVQTDSEEPDVLMPPAAKRRKFCPPAQRLLWKLLADRARHGHSLVGQTSPTSASAQQSLAIVAKSNNVEMKDAEVNLEDTARGTTAQGGSQDTSSNSSPLNVGTTTYPLPSQAAHTHKTFKPPAAPKLHLSTLPPVPTFPSSATSASSSSASATTPGLTTTATAMSPTPMTSGHGSHAVLTAPPVTPSPARKKLSLGDYMSRRLASTPSTEKSQVQVGLGGEEVESAKVAPSVTEPCVGTIAEATQDLRPGQQLSVQVAAEGGLSSSTLEDTPMKDEPEEPEYSPPEPIEPVDGPSQLSTGVSGAVSIPPEVTNVLAQLARFRK